MDTSNPNPFAQAYIMRMIIETCRATGHICDRWIDNDIYESKSKFDEENGTKTADEYLNSCHYPVFFAKPPYGEQKEWKFELKCQGPLIKYEKCFYKNGEAELILSKHIMDCTNANILEDDIYEFGGGKEMEPCSGTCK